MAHGAIERTLFKIKDWNLVFLQLENYLLFTLNFLL